MLYGRKEIKQTVFWKGFIKIFDEFWTHDAETVKEQPN